MVFFSATMKSARIAVEIPELNSLIVRWRSKAGVGFRTKGATYFSLIPLCRAQSQFQRRSIATDGPGARRCNLNQHGRREEWLHRLAAVFPESNSEAYFQHRQQQQRWCPIFACFLNNLFIYSRLKSVAGFPLSAQSDASRRLRLQFSAVQLKVD